MALDGHTLYSKADWERLKLQASEGLSKKDAALFKTIFSLAKTTTDRTLKLSEKLAKAREVTPALAREFFSANEEMGIPCVVGTKNATRVFRDGQLIEVDAVKGSIAWNQIQEQCPWPTKAHL